MDIERHYTYREVAELFSLSERTIQDLVRSCRLRHVRIGRAVRIPVSAVEEYVATVTVRSL